MRHKSKHAVMLRYPRTTQERRANGKRQFLEVDGYRIRLRGKRSAANLPTSYDDIFAVEIWKRHRCWKRLRLNQWKSF